MAQGTYDLGFISDVDIFNHVKNTVLKYKALIDLTRFNKNVIDPIKLTFDAKVYGKTFEEIIESECIRQIDKANNNHIEYFHQNLFSYADNGWYVPETGFDVANDRRKIYVEMKNKYNTMNSDTAQTTYIKMQDQLLRVSNSTCMLVEVIAKQSQDRPWKITLDNQQYEHDNIRRVSIDKFYDIVFGDPNAFMKLCKALPRILDDVISDTHENLIENRVYSELQEVSADTFKSLYLLAFENYEGFNRF